MDPDQAPDTGDRAPSDAGPVATRQTDASQDVRENGLPNGATRHAEGPDGEAGNRPDAAVDGVVPGAERHTKAAAGNGSEGGTTDEVVRPEPNDKTPAHAVGESNDKTPVPPSAEPVATPAEAEPPAEPVATPAEAEPSAVPEATPAGPRREQIPWLIIWSAIGVVVGALAAVELVFALSQLIELLLIAGFLAVVLSPAVAGLVKLGMRRGLATAVVFLLGMAAFGGLGYLFIHPLYRQATHLANDLPGTLARVQAGKGRIGKIVARYHLQNDAAKYAPKVQSYLSHLGGPALSAAKTVLTGLGSLVVLLIMTFLILLEGPSAVRALLRLMPPRHGRRVRHIMDDIARSVTGYVLGNFATSVIAGVVCGTTLILLHVPFAVVFGVWVAMVDLLPLVGGLLAGVPTVAFAFLYSPTAGIITLIVFLVYQQVENHLLNPVIMSRTVKLNPLWVLLSVLAGAELAGIVGALLAIPAAGTIHVIARDVWDERRGRPKATPTEGPDKHPIS
ncbi:MAG: AI-2E family transporter [Acidimicrobiales bacterium]